MMRIFSMAGLAIASPLVQPSISSLKLALLVSNCEHAAALDEHYMALSRCSFFLPVSTWVPQLTVHAPDHLGEQVI
jgi:hypothetical protein